MDPKLAVLLLTTSNILGAIALWLYARERAKVRRLKATLNGVYARTFPGPIIRGVAGEFIECGQFVAVDRTTGKFIPLPRGAREYVGTAVDSVPEGWHHLLDPATGRVERENATPPYGRR